MKGKLLSVCSPVGLAWSICVDLLPCFLFVKALELGIYDRDWASKMVESFQHLRLCSQQSNLIKADYVKIVLDVIILEL